MCTYDCKLMAIWISICHKMSRENYISSWMMITDERAWLNPLTFSVYRILFILRTVNLICSVFMVLPVYIFPFTLFSRNIISSKPFKRIYIPKICKSQIRVSIYAHCTYITCTDCNQNNTSEIVIFLQILTSL